MEFLERLKYYKSIITGANRAKKRSDKTKLTAMVNALDIPAIVLTSEDAELIYTDILKKFNSFKKWANEQINTL
jgi:hypothetical protein